MIPTLSQVCSLNSPFDTGLEDYAAGKCPAIEIWLTKLEDYLQHHTVDDFRKLVAAAGVTTPVASYQGGMLISQGDARAEAWRLFRSRLDLCRECGIGTLVVACDMMPPLTQVDVERGRHSLVELAQAAGQRGMRVALEFQARSALGNNLQTAVALVEEVGSPHLGLCLDLFQFYIGPSKMSDLVLLHPHHLFHVQVSDLADVPREFASDSDRILPGDGDFYLDPVIDHLRTIGYADCVSVELMNPQIWNVPARQFGEIAMTALRKLLGQASM